ncbi:MAG TPA: HAMP domain-containing sensor histidine kinase [Candidatus Cybelea sp.]|nr:HAMP domain-containing sensor histidine kinase [Candidatus Cybelea sp.]
MRAFLATIGHELRTPLASINGYLESVLEGGNDPRTTRRFLKTAQREALRLGRLVDGLLVRSPFESSGEVRRDGCDVVEQIRATIEMLSPMAAARRVTIRTHLPEALRARVEGDACVHALANLLDNAVKHGREDGTVDISCVCEGPFVAVAVEDDGGGIAPEARDAIFTMGVRATSAARAGNGIGLAVVKAVAERAGGDVRVERSRSGGARFVLRFPAG